MPKHTDAFDVFKDGPIPKEFVGGPMPKEFADTAQSDPRFRDFADGSMPVERYGEERREPTPEGTTQRAIAEAKKMQVGILGKVVLIFVGLGNSKRSVDLSTFGPPIGLDATGKLKIAGPMTGWPVLNVMKDPRGNTIEDLNRMNPKRREALLKRSRYVKEPLQIERYAAGTWNGRLVLAPVTGFLIHRVSDYGGNAGVIEMLPDDAQKWPMLLFERQNGTFEIVGGGGHVIR
jgi:hypothetical protein